jgi:hypothetical protein
LGSSIRSVSISTSSPASHAFGSARVSNGGTAPGRPDWCAACWLFTWARASSSEMILRMDASMSSIDGSLFALLGC